MSPYKMALSVSLCLAFVLISSVQSWSVHPVGIYGVSQDYPELSKHNIGTVFLPPVLELINSQAATGREVFLSLNVFGGSQAWKEYPDSIPITSDGQKLTGNYGGVCPTNVQWRESRLLLLANWLEDFGGESGIAGVFLDFIRYPGKWEQPHPEIIDTCYCDRCLLTFQTDTRVEIPKEFTAVLEKSSWIKQHASLKWMEWKKGNIVSFVRDVRGLLDKYSAKRTLKLGVFLVPWKKSDFDGAISFHLAQDAEQFMPYVDVFAPMTYHQMVDQPVDWVEDISRYFKEMTGGEIWPIIQAEGVTVDEFVGTIGTVSHAGAARLLVYNYAQIKPAQWERLSLFSPTENLIPNPTFDFAVDSQNAGDLGLADRIPFGWLAGEGGIIRDTRFQVRYLDDTEVMSIGITAGKDRMGSWSTALPECNPDEQYRFTAEFYREDRQDSGAYPEVSIWGEKKRLNTHRMIGDFQKLYVDVECPSALDEQKKRFMFINHSSGNTFWMRNPLLVKVGKRNEEQQIPPDEGFFPIGVYGGSADNLAQMRESGLNTAVVRLDEKNVSACMALDIHCTLSVPKDPEKLLNTLNQLDTLLQKGRFSFYVNDEPGLHSFPVWKAEDIQRIIKKRYPERFTNMAVLRPQVIPEYQGSADYFMLDQYPIPSMPLVWLSDSMDEAAGEVGRNRLQSVIQAFGGERFAYSGWPRLPTYTEMNNLAFLSVIHGSRGIYFYTWPEITATKDGKDGFEKVIRRLNSLRSWLQKKSDPEPVTVSMVSRYGVDPSGNLAVHCVSKTLYGTKMLMCANSIRTYTEAEIGVPGNGPDEWQEYYTGEQFYTVDDTVRLKFEPLEVKVLMETIL